MNWRAILFLRRNIGGAMISLVWPRQMICSWRRYRAEQRGAAAAEFALVLTLLTVPLLNVIDLAMYAWDRMQLENAAQVAAQAAWAVCPNTTNLPATPNSYAKCPAMPAAVTTAVRSTSLGTNVTVTATTENYYCVNTTTNTLVTVGSFPGTKPANCSSVGSATDAPGDYVQITASYTFTPIFPAASIASVLTSPITRIAWTRMG
jgi:Flp pilus assembly protein TadG